MPAPTSSQTLRTQSSWCMASPRATGNIAHVASWPSPAHRNVTRPSLMSTTMGVMRKSLSVAPTSDWESGSSWLSLAVVGDDASDAQSSLTVAAFLNIGIATANMTGEREGVVVAASAFSTAARRCARRIAELVISLCG